MFSWVSGNRGCKSPAALGALGVKSRQVEVSDARGYLLVLSLLLLLLLFLFVIILVIVCIHISFIDFIIVVHYGIPERASVKYRLLCG